MNNDCYITPLSSDQIGDVVALVQKSFSQELMPLMIHGQRGISHYLDACLERHGIVHTRPAFTVRHENGETVGFAEFDLRGTPTAHLAYVCVAPSHRGRGIATGLIREFAAAHPEITGLTLDVFEENTSARALYRHLGLEERGRSKWLVRDLPEFAIRQLNVDDLAQSLAVHSTYGFSALQAGIGERRREIGRLGDDVARFSSIEDFSDDELLAAVRSAFGAKRGLLIASEDTEQGPGVQALVTSIRMEGALTPHHPTALEDSE